MVKPKDTGVYQKKDGYWEYRFVIRVDGKKIGRKKCTDEHGNKFSTKKEAMIAREEAMRNLRIEKTEKPRMVRKTVKEVFEAFRTEGRKDRAYKTKLKQDIMVHVYKNKEEFSCNCGRKCDLRNLVMKLKKRCCILLSDLF